MSTTTASVGGGGGGGCSRFELTGHIDGALVVFPRKGETVIYVHLEGEEIDRVLDENCTFIIDGREAGFDKAAFVAWLMRDRMAGGNAYMSAMVNPFSNTGIARLSLTSTAPKAG